jgi:hypothetical protein
MDIELAVAITNLRSALRDATEALERIDALARDEPAPVEWKPFINQLARVVREPYYSTGDGHLFPAPALSIGDEVVIRELPDSTGDVEVCPVGVDDPYGIGLIQFVRLSDLEPL